MIGFIKHKYNRFKQMSPNLKMVLLSFFLVFLLSFFSGYHFASNEPILGYLTLICALFWICTGFTHATLHGRTERATGWRKAQKGLFYLDENHTI